MTARQQRTRCHGTRVPCIDCRINCGFAEHRPSEWYMVTDQVWAAAGMGPSGYLCIGCLERRLGRELDRSDFTVAPVNNPGPWHTRRLNDRLGPMTSYRTRREA